MDVIVPVTPDVPVVTEEVDEPEVCPEVAPEVPVEAPVEVTPEVTPTVEEAKDVVPALPAVPVDDLQPKDEFVSMEAVYRPKQEAHDAVSALTAMISDPAVLDMIKARFDAVRIHIDTAVIIWQLIETKMDEFMAWREATAASK